MLFTLFLDQERKSLNDVLTHVRNIRKRARNFNDQVNVMSRCEKSASKSNFFFLPTTSDHDCLFFVQHSARSHYRA
jgi:hypothetical protein